MKTLTTIAWISAISTASLLACGEDGGALETADPSAPALDEVADLPLGDVEDLKADGDWGHATECKAIPDLPPLTDPAIVVSLGGHTVRLWDRAGDYERVFPVGVGALEDGESLTPTSEGAAGGVFWTHTDQPPVDDGPTPEQARWGWNQRCRMWWTDSRGHKVPVFAGLPFIRLSGPPTASYGLHGPVDRYTNAKGGTLRRGYVSHGCMRMEADDIVELYARIQGHKVPVKVQRLPERREDGSRVDIPGHWIASECQSDADCAFEEGFCHTNSYSGRGFCTQRCERYCPDRSGYPGTFCVDDPADPDEGICVMKPIARLGGCRSYDEQVRVRRGRHGQPWVKRDVCLPGSGGWIGDPCVTDAECDGDLCLPQEDGPGICSEPCTRYCPDRAGEAGTFCVDDLSGEGTCLARCEDNSECPLGTTCEREPRHGQAWVERKVCLPY